VRVSRLVVKTKGFDCWSGNIPHWTILVESAAVKGKIISNYRKPVGIGEWTTVPVPKQAMATWQHWQNGMRMFTSEKVRIEKLRILRFGTSIFPNSNSSNFASRILITELNTD
jgi:hypothetical protein